MMEKNAGEKEARACEFAMCGYRCDLCRAYAPNIEKDDRRAELSAMWGKYYGLDILPEQIYCDGCRADRPDAKRIDAGCPVRACVLEKGLVHCGDCGRYPCDLFDQRKGLCFEMAKRQLGERFDADEYAEYLAAYDNKTRLDAYRNLKGKGDFYCEQVLSGRIEVQKVIETENVLAFHHTKPAYPSHVVVIPKRHVPSLIALESEDDGLLTELMSVVKQVAKKTVREHGACRVITNLGEYQDSKHLHFHVVYGKAGQ